MWQSGQTKNLIPALQSGIDISAQGWGKDCDELALPHTQDDFTGNVISAKNTSGDIGTDKYTGGVYYTVKLSDTDMVRAKKGDLSIDASAKFWYQASTDTCVSVRVEFFSQSGTSALSTERKTDFRSLWSTGATRRTISLDRKSIPAETSYMRIWFSNWGANAGRPSIGEFKAYLYDSAAPALTSAALYKVNGHDYGSASAPQAVTFGDTIVYGVTFDEAVNIVASGEMRLALDGTHFVSSSNTSLSEDRRTVYYTFTLLKARYSGELSLMDVNGLEVTDDAGNKTILRNKSLTAETYPYYKEFSITKTLDNITSNAADTAAYGKDLSFTLTAAPGYSLPASLTIKAGTKTLAESVDYTYSGTSGAVTIKGLSITGDITITASGVPNKYNVALNGNGATGMGTSAVNATFGEIMPNITAPSRTGYTFLGYFDALDGGKKYYEADGSSTVKYNVVGGTELFAQWSANKYTVKYDKNKPATATHDITGTMPDSTFTYDKNEALRASAYSLEGWTFCGWAATPAGAVAYTDAQSVSNIIPEGSITLYAVWSPNTYDVVLDAQGGSGSATVTATYDSNMPVIVAPDKPGYLFGGYFSKANGGGTKYYNADCSSARTYDKTERITLYAAWTPITYNIQLYSRGRNVGTLKDVTYGELRLPSAESLGIDYPNYNFVGWNVYDEQNWAMYTADRTYAAGLVTEQGKTAYIYAAWLEKDKYTVTYDANGGTGAPPAVEIHVDETITLSDAVPSRENYTFIGWAENAEAHSAQYQPGDSLTMGNALVTLFALWEKNPSLVYHANGGVFSTYAGTKYPAAGSQVMLTGAQPQKEGYRFCGWAESEMAAVADVVSSPYTMPDHDTVLYAVYEPMKYKIDVHTVDGYSVAGISADGYPYGEYAEFTVTGTEPKVYINGVRVLPENGRYRFVVNSDSTVIVSDSSAIYVIYSANGGVNAPVDIAAHTSGSQVVVKSGLPVRGGYVCSGWAEEPDAESAKYVGEDRVTVASEDMVLYAVWEPVSYTVKYDSNGGEGDMAATTAVYDKEFAISENTFTKEGRQFVGWSYAAGGELAYANGAKVKNLADTQDAQITLYAVWKGAKTNVHFQFMGGSSGTTSCEAAYGELLPSGTLAAPNRYGYQFAGYYTLANKGGEQVYNADMSLAQQFKTKPWNSVATDVNLFAAWEPVSYTVAFVNGTETLADTVNAVYGQSFALPSADKLGIAVPEGYSFKGWSVASGSDAVYYSDGQEITTGLTGENGVTVYLYAVILENVSYTVTLPASGEGYEISYDESALTDQTDVKVNQNEDISFAIAVEEGYSPDKLTVLANGIMLGATRIQGNTYIYSIKNITADTSVNIYNIKKEAFSVILNAGTGYSISPEKATVESGEDFTFTVTLLEGYKTATPVVYINGQTADGMKNGDEFTYTIPAVTTQPVISVSVIPKPQHTVTFVSNGSVYSVSTVEEDRKALQPDAPERQGYAFGGWHTDIGCTAPYDFGAAVTSPVTLFAKWTTDTYVVEYNKNTADSAFTPDAQEKKHDIVLALSPDVPSRVGYTFTGWNTKADGTGTSYGAGGELSVNSNITLYAQWKINQYAVTLVAGDGVTAAISANEAVHNGTVQITATVADGYRAPFITAVPQENAEMISEGLYRITGPVTFVAAAEPKTVFTANFYLEDGLYYTQSALEGSAALITLPNPPEKQGHSFTGWYTEQTGGTAVNAATALDKNMAVYARFEANRFTVTPAQSKTGYQAESADRTEVTYGGDYTFTVTIADHYNANHMRVYANGIVLDGRANGNKHAYTVKNITADTVITVEDVRADVYTVSYYVDDAVYYSQQITYNDTAAAPVNPVISGKTFQYWGLGGTEWNFDNAVTKDMTLKAVWERETYTVTPAENGTGYAVSSNDKTVVNYGGEYRFTVTIADHYNAGAMKVYANGVLLLPDINGNEYKYTVKNITRDTAITVSDVKADIYTVKYIVDGETYQKEAVTYTEKTQKPKAPVKQGHVFDGWFIGGDEWDFAAGIENDLELEARFTPLLYKVTLPENQSGFTVSVTSANPVEYGRSFSFSIVVADGYDTSDMTVYANGVLLEKTSEDGNTVSFEIPGVTEATVVTVRGIGQNTYAVTYKQSTTEYVGNMPENAIKAYDSDIEISDLIPERYGYNFIGWSAEENGAAAYHGKDVYSENSDLTLYAVWEAKTFGVTFETNGGSINGGEIAEYTYGTGAVLPTEVTKEGYDFAGWYEDELLQGVRVYEIKESDYGDKKYYAAYSIADVALSGYTGEYDGKEHIISYTLTEELSVEKYQWYFVPDGASEAVAVPSDSYHTYAVKDAAQSGEYYCSLECLIDSYVVRFFTERATVTITKRPITVKAADGSKVYDTQPLATNEIALADGSSLADGHTMSAVMTAESTLTNVGTQTNEIAQLTILDGENRDVTENYEITKQNGTLTVTPLALTVTAKNATAFTGSALNLDSLYQISGMLDNEKLSLANAAVTAKNADGQEVAFADITKDASLYTVTINYSGFDGEGGKNYQGSGTIVSSVTVYKRSGGGGGGGSASSYTVKFDTNGAGEIKSQSVKRNGTVTEPATPEKDGYTFEGWFTDKALSTAYDFETKVTKAFTLYAKWKNTEKGPGGHSDECRGTAADHCPSLAFKDLDVRAWYHLDVDYVLNNDIMKGTDTDEFSPDGELTRAMLVAILYRTEEEPEATGASTFEDVEAGAYYENAVSWAQDNGIVKGYSDTEFRPDETIVREQIAAIMHRYAQYKGYDVSAGEKTSLLAYRDAQMVSEYAIPSVQYAVGSGLLKGNTQTTLDPQGDATRAEFAAILHRFVNANR